MLFTLLYARLLVLSDENPGVSLHFVSFQNAKILRYTLSIIFYRKRTQLFKIVQAGYFCRKGISFKAFVRTTEENSSRPTIISKLHAASMATSKWTSICRKRNSFEICQPKVRHNYVSICIVFLAIFPKRSDSH